MKALYPILAIGVTVALFYFYIDPQYQAFKVQQAKLATIKDANAKTVQLAEKLVRLSEIVNSIDEPSTTRLTKLLPDHVDNIRLLLDVNEIAGKYSMRIRNVTLDTISASSGNDTDKAPTVESVVLKFSVSGTYATFKTFMRDLEQSLRLVDIEELTITPSATNVYDYSVAVRTYWLKP